MAQFRGKIIGKNAGTVTRLGTKNVGMAVELDGWNGGIRVVASHENGEDVFTVVKTGGSHAATNDETIAVVRVPG